MISFLSPSGPTHGRVIGSEKMRHVRILIVATALTALTPAVAADAESLPFSGTITGIGSGALDSSCAPLTSRGTLSASTSSGSSNLGSFTYDHNWCFNGPSGPISGTFDLFFGADTIHGTLTGMASPSGTIGLTNLDLAYTILSGTGEFSGATGAFGGIATADSRGRTPTSPLFTLNFTGNIDAPALPEPGTWAMMLVGFSAIGWVVRRKNAKLHPAFATATGTA